MVAAKKHHSDDESSDVSSDDQTSDQQSSDQESGQSLTERICHAVQGNDAQLLLSLLPLAHIITAGQSMTASAIVGIAQSYCASHGF